MFDISKQFTMEVLVGDRPVTEYAHQGNMFVEGRQNSEFAIRLGNNSYDPVMAIVAVDGLNVMDGSVADNKGSGYVIDPGKSIVVKGWTKDMNFFNAFYFAGRGSSYSERVGKGPSNNGVIGAMFFRPKLNIDWKEFHETHPFNQGDALNSWSGGYVFGTSAAISAAAPRGITISSATTSNALGAGYGSQRPQTLVETEFTKRDPDNPDALLVVYYDDRKGLERRGIVVDQNKALPDAFPSYNSSSGIGVPAPKR